MFTDRVFPQEGHIWRAVTGGLYNIRGIYGTLLPVKGTIPLNQTLTGTISVTGKTVRGTGTTFLDGKIAVGDYLYASEVVRKVQVIHSNDMITLDYEFPVGVTGQPLRVVKVNAYRGMITARSTGSADVTKFQEAPFRMNDVAVFSAPISYDATAGEISFTVND